MAKRKASFASLSGGQRQRLFVALALVNRPEVVFLDELTTGLDPAARRETWGLIEAIRDQGTTVVLVTHFMDEASGSVTGSRSSTVAAWSPWTPRTAGRRPRRRDPGVVQRRRQESLVLERVPHVRQVRRRGEVVEVEGAGPVVAHVGHALVARGLEPEDLRVHQPTLEDVYLRLTGPDGQKGGSGADAGRDDLG